MQNRVHFRKLLTETFCDYLDEIHVTDRTRFLLAILQGRACGRCTRRVMDNPVMSDRKSLEHKIACFLDDTEGGS